MIDKVHDLLDKVAAMGHGVEAIAEISRWALADDKHSSAEALHTIATITETLTGMFDGKISAMDTEEEIQAVRHALIGLTFDTTPL